MKIVIAADSFKETLSSSEVNDTLESAVLKIFPEAQVSKVKIADGGEGTVDCILSVMEGREIHSEVSGPLPGMRVNAKWCIVNNGRDAIIESASVVGLSLIPIELRNPRIATTFGIGELIKIVLGYNVENIYLALGGTSTNDGGCGIAQGIGIIFLDKDNNSIGYGGEKLLELKKIDRMSQDLRIRSAKFICLCDVENVICGLHGASHTYALQKGATHGDAVLLNEALYNYVKVIKSDISIDIHDLKSGGAAGGIAGGMKAFFNAELKNGIRTILELINFNNIIMDADLIITGEGKIDSQTIYGKVISGISETAKNKKIPVIAFCGIMEGIKRELQAQLNLKDIIPVVGAGFTREQSFENPAECLYQVAIEGLRKIKQ
jgi:glycerate 2-kinase